MTDTDLYQPDHGPLRAAAGAAELARAASGLASIDGSDVVGVVAALCCCTTQLGSWVVQPGGRPAGMLMQVGRWAGVLVSDRS